MDGQHAMLSIGLLFLQKYHEKSTKKAAEKSPKTACRSDTVVTSRHNNIRPPLYDQRCQIDRQARRYSSEHLMEEAREEQNVRVRHDDRHSRRICRRWESAGMVFAERPVIGVAVEKPRRLILQQDPIHVSSP